MSLLWNENVLQKQFVTLLSFLFCFAKIYNVYRNSAQVGHPKTVLILYNSFCHLCNHWPRKTCNGQILFTSDLQIPVKHGRSCIYDSLISMTVFPRLYTMPWRYAVLLLGTQVQSSHLIIESCSWTYYTESIVKIADGNQQVVSHRRSFWERTPAFGSFN